MSAKELVFGAPVILYKSEGYRVLKHNTAAEAFQDSLQVGGSAVKLPKAKPCRVCNKIKPLGMFSINKSCIDDRINKCKVCTEKERIAKITQKKCILCDEVKTLSEFTSRDSCRDGTINRCKACMRVIELKRYYDKKKGA